MLIFIVLSFFILICVPKFNIIQTIHLLALNYLLRVKVMVKNARKWFKQAFSYQYFVIFLKSLVQNCLNICFESLRYVVYETKVKKIWH